jgi:hypothetical protein
MFRRLNSRYGLAILPISSCAYITMPSALTNVSLPACSLPCTFASHSHLESYLSGLEAVICGRTRSALKQKPWDRGFSLLEARSRLASIPCHAAVKQLNRRITQRPDSEQHSNMNAQFPPSFCVRSERTTYMTSRR